MKTCLIVDNDPICAHVLTHIVKIARPDFLVTEVINPVEAIKIANGRHFDYAFIDYCMPDFTGADVCKRLNKDCVSVIITAAEITPTMIWECVQSGAAGFINKPFETSSVINVIRGAINQHTDKPVECEPQCKGSALVKTLVVFVFICLCAAMSNMVIQ